MNDTLKDLRHERNKFRDKFDHLREDFQEIKRQRDQYREKLERSNGFDDRSYPTGRSSPSQKWTDEHLNKRPISRTSMKSSQHLRQKNWTRFEEISFFSPMVLAEISFSDDDYRVEKFRQKHAATVIQRGWRQHHRSHRHTSSVRHSYIHRWCKSILFLSRSLGIW